VGGRFVLYFGLNSKLMAARKRLPQAKSDNPEQYRRFVEAAREAEADESPDALDRAFERVVKPKRHAANPRVNEVNKEVPPRPRSKGTA